MSKTILVVDDSSTLRQVVSISLKGAGFNVIEACDGKDACSKLDGSKIHLIISDVNMPNMNGIEFLKQVKSNPNYKFTPVIMLTTESQEDMKMQGKAAGAKAWMVKPFKADQMLNAVTKLVAA